MKYYNPNLIPQEFTLNQNYPNPFNPSTMISFGIPEYASVKIDICNILGHKVKTWNLGSINAGNYLIIWDGKDNYGRGVESGMYLYTLRAGDYIETKKMVFMK